MTLHLIGAAVFAGGLVMLGLVGGVARAKIDERTRIEFFRSAGRRFGVAAAASLALLIATGIYMADRRLDTISQLLDTEWGRVLSAKLGLVLLILALVAVHSFVIGPSLGRMRERQLAEPDDRELAQRILRRQVVSVIVNASLLLATLAVLVLAAELAGL